MPLFRARCCYGRCRELVRDPADLSRLWPGHIATLRACAQICTAQVRSSPRLTDQQPLWQGATVEQRQRLHGALFPKGLTYDGENFGTVVTCVAFSQLQDQKNSKEGMASPRNNRDRGLSLPLADGGFNAGPDRIEGWGSFKPIWRPQADTIQSGTRTGQSALKVK